MNKPKALKTKRKEIPHLFESGQSCTAAELGKFLLAGQSEARFEGINSMPMFRRFAKKFTHTHDGFIGHNDNGALESAFSGPGYFRLADSAEGEALFDYRDVPNGAPNHWPKVRSNRIVPYRFVYGNMVDAVRLVADDLVAGKAHRLAQSGAASLSHAKEMGVYFLLVRS